MADSEYEIETIDSKVVKWCNIEFSKVWSKYMKNKEKPYCLSKRTVRFFIYGVIETVFEGIFLLV